jgi:hypothetical protein
MKSDVGSLPAVILGVTPAILAGCVAFVVRRTFCRLPEKLKKR